MTDPKPYSQTAKLGYSVVFLACLVVLGISLANFSPRGILGTVVVVTPLLFGCWGAVNSPRWGDD